LIQRRRAWFKFGWMSVYGTKRTCRSPALMSPDWGEALCEGQLHDSLVRLAGADDSGALLLFFMGVVAPSKPHLVTMHCTSGDPSYINAADVEDAKQPLCATMVPRGVFRGRPGDQMPLGYWWQRRVLLLRAIPGQPPSAQLSTSCGRA
jgi:hypothetical protein